MNPTQTTIRVLIVDDHRLFNDGLRAMLSDVQHITVVGQLYYSPDTISAIQQLQPDIVIVDFNMPRMNGLDVAKSVLANFPNQHILIISMYTEERYVEQFRKLGVKGYLSKTVTTSEVIRAIEAIQIGQLWFRTDSVMTIPTAQQPDDYFLKTFKLTSREVGVIRLIRQGLSSSVIADQLSISIQTVETHRKNICMKLNLKGRNELLRFAIEQDI